MILLLYCLLTELLASSGQRPQIMIIMIIYITFAFIGFLWFANLRAGGRVGCAKRAEQSQCRAFKTQKEQFFSPPASSGIQTCVVCSSGRDDAIRAKAWLALFPLFIDWTFLWRIRLQIIQGLCISYEDLKSWVEFFYSQSQMHP